MITESKVANTAMKFNIRKLHTSDISWVIKLFKDRWAGDFIVSQGRVHYPQELRGFIAQTNNKPVGLVTFKVRGTELEIISLDSLIERKGIGAALVQTVLREAEKQKLSRVWVITTNDNLKALRFYQKRGFQLASIYANAVELSRKLKPTIPLVGQNGIPIRDEIELEIRLS